MESGRRGRTPSQDPDEIAVRRAYIAPSSSFRPATLISVSPSWDILDVIIRREPAYKRRDRSAVEKSKRPPSTKRTAPALFRIHVTAGLLHHGRGHVTDVLFESNGSRQS